MIPSRNRSAAGIERFFQFSLLGLVATAFCALAGSGRLDPASLAFVFVGLIWRALIVLGWLRFTIPQRAVTAIALCFLAFYPVDYYLISRDFFAATVHGVCFLGVVRILSAHTNRDYVYTGAVAFIALVGAAIFSYRVSFFLWLILFLVFAIATLTSAEIRRGLARSERTFTPPGTRMIWRLALVTLTAISGLLALTAGFFLLVPRTARATAMLFPNAPRLSGFTRSVDLGRFGEIGKDDRPVMHVLSYSGALPPNLKWRGAALSEFDGRRWSEPPVGVERVLHTIEPDTQGPVVVADPVQRSRRDGNRLLYRADVASADGGTLFIAGIPEFVNVQAQRLVRTSDDSFHVQRARGDPPGEPLQYEVSALLGESRPYPPLTADERPRYLELPAVDKRIPPLAREWAGEGPDAERAARIERRLQNDYQYSLDVSDTPQRDPLANFLFVARRGYCEYFASAMAVMLRSIGIPSRVVTGLQSGYYNDISGLYVMRASDAHAWVEAWIADRGWVTFDPTPFGTGENQSGFLHRAAMYLDAADSAWQQWVVSWSLSRQAALALKVEQLRQRTALPGLPARRPGIGGALFALGAVIAMSLAWLFVPRFSREFRSRRAVRRIRRSPQSARDAGILYERMLTLMARRGYQKPAWFTPLEFASHLPAGEREKVTAFTVLYNDVRFGGNPTAAGELAQLLERFELI